MRHDGWIADAFAMAFIVGAFCAFALSVATFVGNEIHRPQVSILPTPRADHRSAPTEAPKAQQKPPA